MCIRDRSWNAQRSNLWDSRFGSCLIILRATVLVLTTAIFILDNLRTNYTELLRFMTTWGYLGVFTFSILAFLDLFLTKVKSRRAERLQKVVSRAAELLFHINFGLHAPITVIYWSFFWRFYYELFPEWHVQIYVVLLHGGLLLLVWLDYILSDLRLNRRQVFLPLLAKALYTGFNVGCYLLSGHEIYPMDYASSTRDLVGILGFLLVWANFELGVIVAERWKPSGVTSAKSL
eukprot:TRINITY_DN5715_c0_g1_i2.p1 TRINITY_DN5715_c0_g1~~TRINITY_DN5715_c0_g1_i2.p1  ORF type:complete len:250 (+),score=57.85 TRINITY_DN5715_c0_g1_i2:54-752(+)